MAYEIPQALRYEEKIILGLTFKQLAYIGAAGLLAVAVWKSPAPLFAKVSLIALFLIIGGALAFLKLDEYASNAIKHYKSPRNMGCMDASMRSFVGVNDIRDDTIVLKDGSARTILQVMPINFAIRSPGDKDAIIQSFQRFLNSLDFPVQILVRTVNLNLDSYLEYLRSTIGKRVSKKRSQKLRDMFEDYCKFLEQYIEENAVQDRLFYLIISGRSAKASSEDSRRRQLEELKIRARVCREGLSTAGLRSRRLNTGQLISLLASFFEGYVEVENDYLSPLTLFERYGDEKNAG